MSWNKEELSGWLRLSLTPGVGNHTARRLLACFGLPQAIFEQSGLALRQVLSTAQANAIQQVPENFQTQLERAWAWLHADPGTDPSPRHILTLADPLYPGSLLNMEDPPLMLYLMGVGVKAFQITQDSGGSPTDAFNQYAPKPLAIVGSRNPSAQGQDNATAFAKELRLQGCTIISGLALGIDAAAHEGALQGQPPAQADPPWPTIAVVGTGLDRVYPKQHHALAHRIAQQGLLLSEFPLGTPPIATNFPKRNRLIAGLSVGTLVVEAAKASGSLLTARLASEQGKEVFAIPGSIHSPQSRGCHALIKQGAKLVECAQDIKEELRWDGSGVQTELDMTPASRRTETPSEPVNRHDTRMSSDTDNAVLNSLGHDPASLDTLQARTGLSTPELQAQLLELELTGHITRLAGGLFQRMQNA